MPSEIASLLDAQAETVACTAALAPIRSPQFAAEAFGMSAGTAKGLTLRRFPSRTRSHCDTVVSRPPIPVPTATPTRSGSVSLRGRR